MKNHGGTSVLPKSLVGCNALDDGAIGRPRTIEDDCAAALLKRVGALADHVAITNDSAFEILADGFSVDGQAIEIEKIGNLCHERAQTARVVEIFHQVFAGR